MKSTGKLVARHQQLLGHLSGKGSALDQHTISFSSVALQGVTEGIHDNRDLAPCLHHPVVYQKLTEDILEWRH